MSISYEIRIPVGRCYKTRIRYLQCPEVLENQDFSADLIELPIQDYVLILSMDQSFRHQIVVDCYAKTVKLGTKVGVGTRSSISTILAVKARKFIRKEGQGFLAYRINKSQDKDKLKDVKVVNKSLKVFQEELNLPSLVGRLNL